MGRRVPSFDFELDATVAGFGVDGEVVSTGEDAYVVFFGENYRVGHRAGRRAERGLLAARDERRPPAWRSSRRSGSADPRYAGTEEVDGADTERIEGTLDAPGRRAGLSGLLAAARRRRAAAAARGPAAGDGPVEAWVAYDDHTIGDSAPSSRHMPTRQDAAGGQRRAVTPAPRSRTSAPSPRRAARRRRLQPSNS